MTELETLKQESDAAERKFLEIARSIKTARAAMKEAAKAATRARQRYTRALGRTEGDETSDQ